MIRRRILLAYALPATFLAALYLPLFTYVTPFYAAERDVSLLGLGAAWIAIRLFDAVTDPAMGWISDHTAGRFGRRRIWLAVSVPLIAIACWQAFVPPEDAGLGHAALWLFLLTLGWTMAQTPYAAWGAEVAEDSPGRLLVTSWREAFVLVGTVGSTILYVVGGEGGAGLEAVALGVCIGLPLAVAVTLWQVPDPLRRAAPEEGGGWRDGLTTLSSNLAFRRLLLAWFVNGAANALPASLFIFFVSDRLGAEEYVGALFLVYFVSAIVGIPAWNWAAGRNSKHRLWGLAMIYACVVFAFALTLGEGDLVAFAIISVLTGLAFGADLALPPAIQADVIADDTERTGRARAGIFFAIWQVATKAALAIASGLAYITLDVAGFEAGQANDDTALMTLAFLYAGVPILLKLAAVALMWRFTLETDRSP